MVQGKAKIFAITTAFFAIFAIIFFTLSITSIGKYTGQMRRVQHMEKQMLAGKGEVLKVPEMIGKLRVADKTNKNLEMQVADLTETSEEIEEELTDLQKELQTVTIAKLVLETDRSGYTKNLVEARETIKKLRGRLNSLGEVGNVEDLDEIEQTLIEEEEE